MQPDVKASPEYVAAFRTLAARIAEALVGTPAKELPVKMYVAGGAALHFYTGARVSRDVDAVFSNRIALPDELDIAYRDADGAARLLYFDRQYSDTLALMHEDAHADAVELSLDGVNAKVLEIRLLSPVDLAVSKISRFSAQDRADLLALARCGLIGADAVRRRAMEALGGYVGSVDRIRNSIELAAELIRTAGPDSKG
jgi:hypothetical protein